MTDNASLIKEPLSPNDASKMFKTGLGRKHSVKLITGPCNIRAKKPSLFMLPCRVTPCLDVLAIKRNSVLLDCRGKNCPGQRIVKVNFGAE
jgi:hypothetical protein